VLEGTASGSPFAAEVIFVVASAAVGKSTMARQLSAGGAIPMLNLAEVPVSTGSLKSLVSDLKRSVDPLQAFHAGNLPIIIDALDEGRLLSGETGFESFLQTTGELLLQDRSVANRPKLVVLGRHESIADADIGLQLGGAGITTRTFHVGSFGETSARRLIDAYARAGTASTAAYLSNPKPVEELISAYFGAIEAALGLDSGTLWTNERGRAFAGYAPVLAALGSLLAKIDNFPQVTTRLKTKGANEAWGVIETVLEEILTRERGKFCDQLAKRIAALVPAEAYDAREQLNLLVAHIHREPVGGSARVNLSPKDLQTYLTMAEQSVAEHPFIRQREPSNDVLGSVILAHAIRCDLLKTNDSHFLPTLSRQPFLWRSLSRQVSGEPSLVDGSLVGFVLNSYWNDPVPEDHRVVIRSGVDPETVRVSMRHNGSGEHMFHAVAPINLFAQARACDIDVEATVKIVGHGSTGTASLFMLHGATALICSSLEVLADAVVLDGDIWLEAEEVAASPRLKLHAKDSCRVGWGGRMASLFPWNRVPSTLPAPYGQPHGDVVASLIQECERRLPAGGVLTLTPSFGVPDDVRMRWIARDFPNAFPLFMEEMRRAGLVSVDESMSAHGERKVRVHFNVAWADLLRAIGEPGSNPKLEGFLQRVRTAVLRG